LSALSASSPLYEYVGDTRVDTSLASVHQLVTEKATVDAEQYYKNVINYAIEWEQFVTTRVDAGLKKTKTLYQDLIHYQHKIGFLREKVNDAEKEGKESPAKLSQKLTRNEAKLDQAYKLHEATASKLCNLLEEITKGGWKDLYPLILAGLQWEVDIAAGEQDANGILSQVEKGMTSIFDEHASTLVVEQGADDPSGGPYSAKVFEDSDSDTPCPSAASISSSDDSSSLHSTDAASIPSSEDSDDSFKTAYNSHSHYVTV
jgi:hypothetical protein